MILYVLDQNYNKTVVMDHYESALWVDRFNKPGEFELYIPAGSELFTYIECGAYLANNLSDNVMIIEGIKIDTDIEDGNKVIVTGRSLESILDRRIVWTQTDFNNANLQNAIKRLINENIISPTIAERRISNFVFQDSTDQRITSLSLTAQYTGDNLLDVINDICEANGLGYKITLNNNKQLVFSLYMGQNRSYSQQANNYVIFSPKFENLLNSNYEKDDKPYKNVTLVAGEGEGLDRVTRTVGSASGLARRELYTDARDVQKKDDEGNEIPLNDYYAKLDQRGIEKLAEAKKTEEFDGETDPFESFIYGEDFFMGDIVQIRNEYGFETASRVIEFIYSDNVSDGLKYYPTFEVYN